MKKERKIRKMKKKIINVKKLKKNKNEWDR